MKPGTRIQGDQAYNRVRNVLGAESGAFKYLDQAGLKAFLATPGIGALRSRTAHDSTSSPLVVCLPLLPDLPPPHLSVEQ